MKSTVKAFAMIVVLAFAAVACNNNIEKSLTKQDGKWQNAGSFTDFYIGGVLDTTLSTFTFSLDIWDFHKGGTGRVYPAGTDTTYRFTWSAFDDGDLMATVTLCQDLDSILGDFCRTSTVFQDESEKDMPDMQHWYSTDKQPGDTNWSETTSYMMRVE